jgi:uncharacterized damage-inducible protein DinB
MDRAAIEELFEYTGFAWKQISAFMAKQDASLVAKPAPGSGWPALRDCFGHQLIAYDEWIAELEGQPMLDFNPMTSDSWPEIEAYAHTVRERFAAYLASLSDDELYAVRDIAVDGEPVRYTPAQLLANVVIHDRGHHGDINTLLYQHGIPEDDWPWLEFRAFAGARRGYPER